MYNSYNKIATKTSLGELLIFDTSKHLIKEEDQKIKP